MQHDAQQHVCTDVLYLDGWGCAACATWYGFNVASLVLAFTFLTNPLPLSQPPKSDADSLQASDVDSPLSIERQIRIATPSSTRL